ncbi:Autophagy protein 7 [Balamuthia mandrillaris]
MEEERPASSSKAGGGGGGGEGALVRFQPLSSAVEVSFWQEVGRRKLELWRLSEAAVPLVGSYATGGGKDVTLPSRLVLGRDAFQPPQEAQPVKDKEEEEEEGHHPWKGSAGHLLQFKAPGSLHNTNTIETFKKLDKNALFRTAAIQIWEDIKSGAAVKDPSLLCRFLLVTFCDLKKYNYYYWFAFPALCFPQSAGQPLLASPAVALSQVFTFPQLEELQKGVHDLQQQGNNGLCNQSAFLVKRTKEGSVQVGALSQWHAFWEGVEEEQRMVAFADACSLPTNPGWHLRNLLLLLAYQFNVQNIQILCYREEPGKQHVSHSLLLSVQLGKLDEQIRSSEDLPGAAVGWEKDKKGKLAPRHIWLGASMDPARLASTAVDLNLQLMRWRVLPSLDLSKIAGTKCLLLGAGTLGCNVARALMGWGVRNITFVDNGKVSYSNPVRQSLFTFEDCKDGGKPKALTAAARLKDIFPDMNAQGHSLSIPMPGHPIPKEEEERVRGDCELLSNLIESHDAVFLLTDSRESRWLPSVIAAAKHKLVINAALGFDTFLVMRHGVPSPDDDTQELGCYFCNDVVAPQDSLTDRTLDQQCTVTRPGVSFMAATMAVELLVSLLHHPLGGRAAAESAKDISEKTECALGLLPHQIRGFLSHFSQLLIVGHAYDKCTACSSKVLKEYKEHGFEFLLKAFNKPSYLEDITGLTEMKDSAANLSIEWDFDDEDDEDSL